MLTMEVTPTSAIVRKSSMEGDDLLEFWNRAQTWLESRYGKEGVVKCFFSDPSTFHVFKDIMKLPYRYFDVTCSGDVHPKWKIGFYSYRVGDEIEFNIAIQVPDEYVAIEMRMAM